MMVIRSKINIRENAIFDYEQEKEFI